MDLSPNTFVTAASSSNTTQPRDCFSPDSCLMAISPRPSEFLNQTGKCGLRVKSGKEYSVTSAYKKNLKPLTEFRIGNGAFLAE